MCILCAVIDTIPESEKERIALKLKAEIDERLMMLKGLGYEFAITGDNNG